MIRPWGLVLPLLACSACIFSPDPTGTDSDVDPPGTATDDSTSAADPVTTSAGTTGTVTTTTGTSSTSNTSSTSSTTSTTSDDGSGPGRSSWPDDDDLPPPKLTQLWAFEAMDLGDIDGDGHLDLVTSGTGHPPRVTIYPGRGDGEFDVDAAVTSELFGFSAFIVADVTGDGRADVLAQGTGSPPRLTVYAGQAGHAVTELATIQVFTFTHMHAGDLTGDGRADVVLGEGDAALPWVQVWPGTDDGLSAAPVSEAKPWRFDVLRVGDVDGDGHADLLTGRAGAPPQLHVYPGDGAGNLGEPVSAQVFNFSQLDLGDLDGDGRSDVITDIPGNAWRFQVYRAGPNGWGGAVAYDAHNFLALELGDLDGDGRADVVLQPTGEPPRVEVYLSPLP